MTLTPHQARSEEWTRPATLKDDQTTTIKRMVKGKHNKDENIRHIESNRPNWETTILQSTRSKGQNATEHDKHEILEEALDNETKMKNAKYLNVAWAIACRKEYNC